ncbi:Mitochondrial transcription factor 1 [Yamadazyma tenuis]|uniref:rRNA adenine N(6)-methyltransferase n=1 Tax=Candida tenuis (strain ATCC 10573 / BCRC 21748 / CBS 615 / JCM 9827 / NBRC 10315 / NRRL Y-1498 / VKM Y-70) TaxID=590646 RepID=G3BE99_CANTC|nr:S-adenosyl-L-methionine-dependent methyltransferase [Yamadazyma tenuis ATCC 10573]EGV60497.1 S-adenosyl-L-methionine-dependent methyltransferase [Yamadazyma tenuis ATCC 10573]WEJ94267.1 Mitochondrial transcription factor 1 [Yamadazyma tenuis]
MPRFCRSFNPLLESVQFFPSSRSSLKSIINPQACQQIIDKLDLKKKYPKSNSLNIVDIFPGFGLFSTMINQELRPKKHILMEETKVCIPHYEGLFELLQKDKKYNDSFVLYPKNGYKWESYETMVNEDKLLEINTQSEDNIHDELLIVANMLTLTYGEAVFAQWLACSAHKNWLQKYGRVRMICVLPEVTAQKFLSGPSFFRRNRSSIKRDLFTDTKLIAINEMEGDNYAPDGYGYDPNLLVKDQPVIVPLTTIYPAPTRMAVVEVNPKQTVDINTDYLDYIAQILMYRRTHPLQEALKYLSPGAEEDLGPKLKHLLEKTPRDLTSEDFHELVKAFESWPFKPSLEERLSLNPSPDDD